MKDEPFNRHIKSARHSLKALRDRLRTIPGAQAPRVEIAEHLGHIEAALDAAALEWSQQRDALAASRTKVAEGAWAEKALRASEEMFHAIADYTANWENWIGTDGKLLWVNPAVEWVTGYSVAEFRAMHNLSMPLSAEEDRKVVRAQFKRAMAGTRETDQEFRFVHKDGTTRWASVSWQPIFARDGTPLGHRSSVRDITRRKQAEAARRENEATARALMESPVDSVLLIDPDGIILDTNQTFAQRIGWRVDELVGKRVYDILPPELVESRRARIDEVVRQGVPIRFEDERAGMHLDQSAFPIFGSKGKVTKIAIVARDITERKRADEALRESEERYRRLFEVESDAIIVVDLETGRFLDANAAAVKLYGYSRAELLALKHGDVSAESLKTQQAIAANETHIPFRWHRRKDGTVFPVEIANSYFESQGRQVHVAAIRDITTRQQAERALKESEARLRSLFENSMVSILLTAPDSRVFAANPAACRMFGRTEADICRLGRSGLVDRRDSRVKVLVQERAEKGYAAGEMTMVRADGTCFPAQVNSVMFETAEGPRTSMVIQDVSERKLAEARIHDFSRKLLSVREEEKRSISAVLHHDVGSFTVGITAHLLAAEGDLRKGKYKEALAVLKEGHRLFAQSVKRLKSLAMELRPPDLDILGLAAALRQHFSLLTKETSLKINFTDATRGMAIPPETQTVLFRVVQESLNNVVMHAHARQVRVRLSAPRKTLQLSIADDGKGFDPVRASARLGTHLGLRAAQEMVAALGGEFVVNASPGRGTTVLVTVPSGGSKT